MQPRMVPGGVARPGASGWPNATAARPAGAAGVTKPGVAPAAAANGGMVKKPVAAAAAGGLRVSTQSKNDGLGIETLVGDYKETGTNHGKKVYMKVQKITGHEDVKVFLYYWDQRDGAESSGWWFGDQVGGTQVWAHAMTHAIAPPRVGWKVPWDAPKAEPGLLFVDQAGAATAGAAPVAAGKALTPAELQERVQRAQAQVEELEGTVKDAVAAGKAVTATSTVEELQAAQQELTKQQTALQEAQKSLTMDVAEARKGGPATTSLVTELSKLSPKLRTLQTQLNAEVPKVRGFFAKAQAGAANAKTAAANKEKEEKDTKELEEALPAVQEVTAASQEAVESVLALAAPLIADPPEDGDMLTQSMEEIEAAAAEAQEKIGEARKEITGKLQVAGKYAPETRKRALTEYSGMQQKITEGQKKLNPYKAFKKEFHQRVAARKALSELADKLSADELEAEKASMMSAAAEHGQMSDEEITSAEKVVQPAKASIDGALRIIEQKTRTAADNATKDELSQMKDKAMGFKKTVDDVLTTLRRQRESLGARDVLRVAAEKVDAAEEVMKSCQEAEMPFLKGLEVLPAEESAKAIKDSEAAAAKTDAAVNQARTYLKGKLAEAKRYVKELCASVTEELTAHQTRLETNVVQKLTTFKKETTERKMSALLAELVDGVSSTEKSVEPLTKAAEVFSSESLDDVSVDTLKEAVAKTAEAEKEAAVAMLGVRKVFAAKQKEVKGAEAAQALAKLQARINAAQGEIAKAKKGAMSGEKLIKGKEVLAEEDKKIKEVEESVNAAQKKVKPGEEEAALGIEASNPTDEEIEAMGTMLAEAQKTVKASSKAVETHVAGAPPALKSALQKLVDRSKAVLATMSEILTITKDQRERVMTGVYVKEGQGKIAEVEAAMEKVNDAELPFLKGLEVIPLQEANDAMKASDAASAAVQAAITAARNLIAQKNLETKQYGKDAAATAKEEFAKLTEEINEAASKLAAFKKETESRKKTALMQEATEKLENVEAEVKKLGEAVEPFEKKEDEAEKEEPAEEVADKMVGQLKATQAAIEDTRKTLSMRSKDVAGIAVHVEALKELNKKLTEAQATVTKHKKIASVYEAKFTAKKVLAEANETLEAIEAEAKKAADAAAPLLEQGGEPFLVAASARTLAQAWRDHMQAKELSNEALYAEVAGGDAAKGGVSLETFAAYLAKAPEALGREELAFSEARREAIFKHADKDGDGKVSPEEFKALFLQRFKCAKEITVTDVFDVSKSKTVAQLKGGEMLETMSGPQKDETSGMSRIECTVVSAGKTEGKTGFITMQGGQGTKFVELISPFTIFCEELDKSVDACIKAATKLISTFNSKQMELGTAKDAALVDARAELMKLKPKVAGAQGSLQKLRGQVAQGKREYGAKEIKEKNAHIEAKERKAAEAITGPATAKVQAMDAAFAGLEEAVKTLVSLSVDEITAFPTPLSVHDEADKLVEAVCKSADEAKEAVATQTGELPKAPKGPMLEAKMELMKMSGKTEATKKKSAGVLNAVRQKCQLIADRARAEASGALRAEMKSKSLNIDSFFSQLVTAGQEKISHEAFCKHVQGLLGESCKAEHVGLLCRQIEAGSIGRRRFQAFVQQYYAVAKSIAITDEFEIADAKTIRKAELDEVIELLDGPKRDSKLGLTRIRGRSLVDGVEGWLGLSGNQGTHFLKEVEKPFYSCFTETPLEREFKSEGEKGVVRTVKADEVLELLEGPRKQVFEPGTRIRGKAVSDGAMGWFTARDRNGTVFAEADSKYFSCTSSVAMTDSQDIKDCKVLRKLAVGELFTVEEGPVEEKEAGITRVKGKCLKDELVGWVTIKGNAGTVYAEASSKHYCVLQEMPLTKLFPSAKPGEEVRKLAKGEAMQVVEGPKEEAYPPETRAKVKAVSDGAVGWIAQKKEVVRPWTPYYTCKVKAPLHEALAAEGATVVREIAVGETLELLEGPSQDDKVLRIKAVADKDGAVGWVTIKDGEGKRLFLS